jgi:putative phage-type endonuclease
MLQQNTQEWVDLRKSKIGASDAPVIMGESPYKTPFQLWQEKLGITESKMNFGMQRGHDLEPKARALFEEMTGLLAQPQVKFHRKRTWMMASLDAVDLSGKAIGEIKCPGADDHKQALEGRIPQKYFPQLQHQMEVCELEEAFYFSFDGQKGVVLKEYRDEKYIKTLLEFEEVFYEHMMSLEPPELCERDYVPNNSSEWHSAANAWKEAKSLLEMAEETEDKWRKKLIDMAAEKNTLGSGVRLSKCIRKGNVDYSKVPALKGVDLDPYRKKHAEFWKFSLVH